MITELSANSGCQVLPTLALEPHAIFLKPHFIGFTPCQGSFEFVVPYLSSICLFTEEFLSWAWSFTCIPFLSKSSYILRRPRASCFCEYVPSSLGVVHQLFCEFSVLSQSDQNETNFFYRHAERPSLLKCHFRYIFAFFHFFSPSC